jgi:hypothetical protein
MENNETTDVYAPLFLLLIDLVLWWLLGQVINGVADIFLNVICLSSALVFLVIFVFESIETLKGRSTHNSG